MNKKNLSIIIAVIILVLLIIAIFVFTKKDSSIIKPSISGDNSVVQNDNIIRPSISGDNSIVQNDNIINNQETELPTKIISGEKKLDNLLFSNIKIIEESANQNLLVVTVKNNGTKNIVDTVILNIELFSESGDSIGIVGGVLPFIAADSIAEMQVPIALNVMHTKDITISYANS